ncbi:alpha/beta hydrolase [Actinospica durhamensis]|uniref:Alpha/beta hydrolase n=1 Tax=Actinospica durhamensis TaxID=1508375 RepID=A0A941EYF3_9ACTN|nr:alpha/beta hydrolase [Actinospica durhamensis]
MSEETSTAPPSATSAFASADGVLAYLDAGPRDGVPLVLLHSAFVDHTEFDDLVPALVGAGHRVIAPDARGHGSSANATRPFRQTDDLADLLRHLGLGAPAVLVGVSMGAMIALDTAVEHPELVRAVVISGRGYGNTDLADPWAAAQHTKAAAALAAGDIPGWLDAFVGWLPGPHRRPDQVDPDLLRRVRVMAMRTLMKHTPDEPDLRRPLADAAARARTLAVPVLAVNGRLDAPGPLATVAALIDSVPDGRTVWLDGAAHYAPMEQPEQYARIVVEFARAVAG